MCTSRPAAASSLTHVHLPEAIARLINELPARHDTENAIAALSGEIAALEQVLP